MMRVDRIIPPVVDPGDRRNAHSNRPRQQGDQIGIDLQAVGIHLHATVREAIDQSGRPAPGLLHLRRSLQPFRGEGVHIARGIIKTAERELQVLAAPPARRVKADQCALLQPAEACL